MQVPANSLFHRHLVAAYIFTWGLQLSYLGYVLAKHLYTSKRKRLEE